MKPSKPRVIPCGALAAVGTANSADTCGTTGVGVGNGPLPITVPPEQAVEVRSARAAGTSQALRKTKGRRIRVSIDRGNESALFVLSPNGARHPCLYINSIVDNRRPTPYILLKN